MTQTSHDDLIVRLAQGCTSRVPAYRFLARGKVIVLEPDLDVYVGVINYDNPYCEIFGAVRVSSGDKVWMFCLEKIKYLPDTYIGAFYNGGHYSFVKYEPDNDLTPQMSLVKFVTREILSIIHNDLYRSKLDAEGNLDVSFVVKMLPEPRLM